MKMTSSVSPARSAASSSSGTVHHAASSGDACTATVSPSARPTAYRPRPGMPITSGEQDAAAEVAAEARKSSPMRRKAFCPGSHSRKTTSATSASPKKIARNW